MSAESFVSIRVAWFTARKLPGLLFRHWFPAEKLAELVYVDVRPRQSAVYFDLGPVARYDIWLIVINRSPFEIVLDRTNMVLLWGPEIKGSNNERITISPTGISEIHIGDTIVDGVATQIARNLKANGSSTASAYIKMEFESSVRRFAKTANLNGVTPTAVNETFRLPKSSGDVGQCRI